MRCDAKSVGAGLWANDKDAIDQPLPNVEAPDDPVKNFKSRPEPACWGFVAPWGAAPLVRRHVRREVGTRPPAAAA